jgi:hypothetical protein
MSVPEPRADHATPSQRAMWLAGVFPTVLKPPHTITEPSGSTRRASTWPGVSGQRAAGPTAKRGPGSAIPTRKVVGGRATRGKELPTSEQVAVWQYGQRVDNRPGAAQARTQRRPRGAVPPRNAVGDDPARGGELTTCHEIPVGQRHQRVDARGLPWDHTAQHTGAERCPCGAGPARDLGSNHAAPPPRSRRRQRLHHSAGAANACTGAFMPVLNGDQTLPFQRAIWDAWPMCKS